MGGNRPAASGGGSFPGYGRDFMHNMDISYQAGGGWSLDGKIPASFKHAGRAPLCRHGEGHDHAVHVFLCGHPSPDLYGTGHFPFLRPPLLAVSFVIMRKYFRQERAPTYPLFHLFPVGIHFAAWGVFAVDGYWSARGACNERPTLFIPCWFTCSACRKSRGRCCPSGSDIHSRFFLFILTLNPDFTLPC